MLASLSTSGMHTYWKLRLGLREAAFSLLNYTFFQKGYLHKATTAFT